MQVANAEFYDQPHWRVIASGFDTEKWFDEDQGFGTGGIFNPQQTRLPHGNFYYRFASSHSSTAAQFGGGWWIDFEAFRSISAFAEQNDCGLRDAARYLLALPYAWTRVDLKVRALLTLPLRAYTGYGKPAQGAADGPDRGTKWIPSQHLKVRQLYIPGLFVKGRKEQLYQTVFQQPMEVTRLYASER